MPCFFIEKRRATQFTRQTLPLNQRLSCARDTIPSGIATKFSRLTYNAPKLARQVLSWTQVGHRAKQRCSQNGPIEAKSGLE